MRPETRPDPPPLGPDADDATLVARCGAGDEQAWAALVRRYQRLVHAIVRRGGLDEHTGADVFQVVFERLLAHLPQLRQPERLQAWIVTTAKREVLAHLARANRHRSIDAEGDESPVMALADDAALPEEALQELQDLASLRDALQRLDRPCAELLALLFQDAEDPIGYDEIARRTGRPRGSIGPSRARCLDKLRRLWGGTQ